MTPLLSPGMPWTSMTSLSLKYSLHEALRYGPSQKRFQSWVVTVTLSMTSVFMHLSKLWFWRERFPSRQILKNDKEPNCQEQYREHHLGQVPTVQWVKTHLESFCWNFFYNANGAARRQGLKYSRMGDNILNYFCSYNGEIDNYNEQSIINTENSFIQMYWVIAVPALHS